MLGGLIGTGIDRDIDNHVGGQGTGMGHWKENLGETDMVVRGCARGKSLAQRLAAILWL
jgi:hypothetical protein